MRIRVGIENNNDDRSIAWALEHPGCFAYGRNAEDARQSMVQAAADYADWIGGHEQSWLPKGPPDVVIDETFDAYFVDRALEPAERGPESWMVESFFRHDWKPLTALEIGHALKLLTWTRQDLLRVVDGLSADQLDRTYHGERWSINGILQHLSSGEWFYQDRIGSPFPEQEHQLPAEPFQRLELVRNHFVDLLPTLAGDPRVIGLEGELWSPRKALRRAVWHERDHTQHIRKLLAGTIAPGVTGL